MPSVMTWPLKSLKKFAPVIPLNLDRTSTTLDTSRCFCCRCQVVWHELKMRCTQLARRQTQIRWDHWHFRSSRNWNWNYKIFAFNQQKILETKRDKLLEQLDEAKQLKEDIDRRGANLSKILLKALTPDEYSDYDYFVNMKAKLIVDSREIADKIKLGEEQLNALKDTLVHSEC